MLRYDCIMPEPQKSKTKVPLCFLIFLDIISIQYIAAFPKRFINNWERHYGFYGYCGSSGGVDYTRWGKTTCPSTTGTRLLYTRYGGGSWYAHRGGGDNFFCPPKQPQYLRLGRPGILVSYLSGSEYQHTLLIGAHEL